MNHAKYLIIAFIVFIIIVLILGYVYYRIVKPIILLKKAINDMYSGNMHFELDHRMAGNYKGLFSDFEKLHLWLDSLLVHQEEADIITGEVIANITHDLKTPLTAIKGYSEGILDGIASTPERLEKYIKTIYTKASDMSLLVDELSFYNNINQPNVQYSFSVVEINNYISECIGDWVNDLEMKKIHLLFETYTNHDTKVRIDTDKCKRVINNIIGNASKYINHGEGIVFVKVRKEARYVIISFEDNGVGIRNSELPYIFDRFYRTDSSRNSTTGGTGLGLSIAKKIITDHGGIIWAESVWEHSTTLFIQLKEYEEERKNEQNTNCRR